MIDFIVDPFYAYAGEYRPIITSTLIRAYNECPSTDGDRERWKQRKKSREPSWNCILVTLVARPELAESDVGFLLWPKDGDFVYFKRLGSHGAILRVDVKTRKVEQILGLSNIKNTGIRGGLWLAWRPTIHLTC